MGALPQHQPPLPVPGELPAGGETRCHRICALLGLGSICLSWSVLGGVSECQDLPGKLPRASGGLVRTLLIVQLLCTQCASAAASRSPDTSNTKFRNSICMFGSLKGMKLPGGCLRNIRTIRSPLQTPALQSQLPARGQSTVSPCSPPGRGAQGFVLPEGMRRVAQGHLQHSLPMSIRKPGTHSPCVATHFIPLLCCIFKQ